jgi:tetratricopeptide (TPR) repeat protein
MSWKPGLATLLAVAVSACGPSIRPLERVADNGEVMRPQSEEIVARAHAEGEATRERIAAEQGAATAAALASCAPAVCEAVSRGELALGMTEAQVLAATRTTAQAWETRGGAGATVMAGRSGVAQPADAVGEIAWVSLKDGRVQSYTYREPQGLRTVATPADATFQGRAAAQADALLRQGDEYAVAGDLARALDRYDRADILRPEHPQTTLRIARTLDKQLRPVEALMRYQRFIHQMELEKIDARGDAAAKMAEAIAQARQRIIVLEKR